MCGTHLYFWYILFSLRIVIKKPTETKNYSTQVDYNLYDYGKIFKLYLLMAK